MVWGPRWLFMLIKNPRGSQSSPQQVVWASPWCFVIYTTTHVLRICTSQSALQWTHRSSEDDSINLLQNYLKTSLLKDHCNTEQFWTLLASFSYVPNKSLLEVQNLVYWRYDGHTLAGLKKAETRHLSKTLMRGIYTLPLTFLTEEIAAPGAAWKSTGSEALYMHNHL